MLTKLLNKCTLALFIIGFSWFNNNTLYAQDDLITLELGKTNIEKALNAIENETGHFFLFNPSLIDINRSIKLNIENATIEQVLDQLFKDTGIEYLIMKKQIILTRDDFIQELKPEPYVVSGTVMDENGQPLPGVNVLIKGTTTGTITDKNGEYNIQVSSPQTVLEYSFVGYKKAYKEIAGRNEINLKMQEKLLVLEEVVKIGYGTVHKTDLTGAVNTITAKAIDKQIIHDLSSSLQGKAPGLGIESLGGNPGNEMRITIRGAGSLSNNDPLILVDEIPVNSLLMVNPSTIQSVQILKDASAAAIYGSRAANGVILVETKSGQSGRMKIDAIVDYGIQELDKKLDLLNAEEWIMVNTLARKIAGLDSLNLAKNPEIPIPGEGTDWQEAMYVRAPVKKIDLAASGGSEMGNYSVSLGWLDQDGIVTNTGFSKINLQAKSEFHKNKLTLGENIILSREFHDNITDAGAGSGNAVQSAVIANPLRKIYLDRGEIYSTDNPVGTQNNVIGLLNLHSQENTLYRMLVSTWMEYEFFEGLKFKGKYAAAGDFSHYLNHRSDYSKQNVYAMGGEQLNRDSRLIENKSTSVFWQLENILTFNRTFDYHRLNMLIGHTSQKTKYRYMGAEVFDLPNTLMVLDAGSLNPDNYGAEVENTLLSYFGRIIYSYDQRYSFTGTFRKDGSSRFSKKHRWGYFPSVAGAWNVANENFFKSFNWPVSILKLRASYGLLGNQEIGDYQYLGLITPSIVTSIGNPSQLWIGNIQTEYPASDIKWESTLTSNIGMDFSMWSGKLAITMDYFHKSTKDMLLRVPIPLSTGVSSYPFGNAGKITNRGLELSIEFNNNISHLFYTISGSFSTINNKVEELARGTQELEGGKATHHGDYVNYTREGFPLYSFFLIKTDGLFRSTKEIQAHSKDGTPIQPEAQVGDMRFIDANNDGQINDEDRVYCGSPFPDFDYGLRLDGNWKIFDFSLFLQGTYGNKIYNGYRTYTENLKYNVNYSSNLLNSYTFNKNSDIPRLSYFDPNGNNTDNTDRFLENGSYLRLKVITLGLNLKDNWLNNVPLVEKARFYLGARNLFTLTPYSGYNSDIGGGGYNAWRGSLIARGIDWSVYPTARSYHAGIQISF